MPRFAVAIVARNEARTLPTLLASLQPFLAQGGEVHLLDTGSDDGTASVAAEGGCRVTTVGSRFDMRLTAHDEARINGLLVGEEQAGTTAGQRVFDFAAARQMAASLPTTDVILQLDGSDEVLRLDIAALDARIARGTAGGFACRMRLGDSMFTMVRFYDRRWYRWEGRTHEGLYPIPGPDASVIPPTVPCPETEALFVHHRQVKERTYLAGLALQVLESPGQSRWRYYFGRELFYVGAFRSAIVHLDAHAAIDSAPSLERTQGLCFIGQCHEALGDPLAADAAYSRASAADSSWRDPFLRRAALASTRGDFAAAVLLAERALAVPYPSGATEVEANYTWRPHAILYWSLFWLGQRDDARRHWEAFVSLAPSAVVAATRHARLFASTCDGAALSCGHQP